MATRFFHRRSCQGRYTRYIEAMERFVHTALFVIALTLGPLVLVGSSAAVAGKGAVGEVAPRFRLETVTGRTVSSKNIQGKPTVIVVGRSRKSAPPCKEWVLSVGNMGVDVYQVVVALKPWFLPRFLVLSEIKDFVPAAYHKRVLVEWRDGFAKAYGVPNDDTPTVLVLDSNNVVRYRHRGRRTTRAMEQLKEALAPRKLVTHRKPRIGTL